LWRRRRRLADRPTDRPPDREPSGSGPGGTASSVGLPPPITSAGRSAIRQQQQQQQQETTTIPKSVVKAIGTHIPICCLFPSPSPSRYDRLRRRRRRRIRIPYAEAPFLHSTPPTFRDRPSLFFLLRSRPRASGFFCAPFVPSGPCVRGTLPPSSRAPVLPSILPQVSSSRAPKALPSVDGKRSAEPSACSSNARRRRSSSLSSRRGLAPLAARPRAGAFSVARAGAFCLAGCCCCSARAERGGHE
jgi:hypothetical protein